jgi:RNA polymerase sigma factor (TIGR02999 family)
MQDAGTVTRLLHAWQGGERSAEDEILALVYEELRQLARQQLRRSRSLTLLETRDLVHEAWVRLMGGAGLASLAGKDDLLMLMSRVMRRVVIDAYRRKSAQRRGGANVRVPLEETDLGVDGDPTAGLALDEALDRLAAHTKRAAAVVEMRYYGGCSVEETATALGVDRTTVIRDWVAARAWLLRELGGGR